LIVAAASRINLFKLLAEKEPATTIVATSASKRIES